MTLHPGARTLGAYADGELGPRRRARVAAHLARCTACRARLLAWRAAGRHIRETPIPPLSPDLFGRIRARRAAGERVILPAASPPRSRRPPRLVSAAAAVLVLVLGGLALSLGAPDLKAEASELRLSPALPAPGARIEAEYHAGSRLAGQQRLVLRARYRTPADDGIGRHGHLLVVTELARAGDGVYRAAFRLPDSVVYAVFAVEDTLGEVVDTNQRQGWELLVHGPDGRPLAGALEQRILDAGGRNFEAAHDAARTATELYPHRPQSWVALRTFQQALLGEAGMDSLRPEHLVRLRALHDRYAPAQGVSGDEAGNLFWFAWGVGDTIAREYWRDRLAREHPAHPLAVQNRIVLELGRMRWREPARFLVEMERMWDEIGPVHSHQGDMGFGAAVDAGDAAAALRWAGRYLHFRPGDRGYVASRLAQIPALRDEGMRRLREEIRRSAALRRDDRELFATARDQRRASVRELRTLYAALGKALLAQDRRQAALDTLALAVEAGWDPRLFREVAEARLAAGDTAGAVALWARVAVDPGTGAGFADSVRARTQERFDPERWRELSSRARAAMRAEALEDAVSRGLRGPVRLAGADGGMRPLDELTGGRPTVVVFWSRFCGYALDAAPELERLQRRLAERGVRVLAITTEPPSADYRAWAAEKAPAFPLYHDLHAEAARAFGNSANPQYFILDGEGRVRFEYTALDALERQVAALGPAE